MLICIVFHSFLTENIYVFPVSCHENKKIHSSSFPCCERRQIISPPIYNTYLSVYPFSKNPEIEISLHFALNIYLSSRFNSCSAFQIVMLLHVIKDGSLRLFVIRYYKQYMANHFFVFLFVVIFIPFLHSLKWSRHWAAYFGFV